MGEILSPDLKSSIPALAGAHWRVDELHQAQEKGFKKIQLRRALLHFGGLCGVCLEAVKILAADPPPAHDGPLAGALERWMTVLAGAPDLQASIDELRPVHRFWVRRSLREKLGFWRLLLEEGHQLSLDQPGRVCESSVALHESILDERLLDAPVCPEISEKVLALRGLAEVYRGDACRRTGDHHGAEQHFDAAESYLENSPHGEIQTTFYELRGRLRTVQGLHTQALTDLDRAEEHVRNLDGDDEIPGRLAEILARRGTVLKKRPGKGHLEAAKSVYRKACSELPDGICPRLRRDILRLLVEVEIRTDDLEAAREHLRLADSLHDHRAPPELRARHCWLWGCLYQGTGEFERAVARLKLAISSLADLGLTMHAIQALSALGQVYVEMGQPEKLGELKDRYYTLIRSPIAESFTTAQMLRLARLGRSLQIETPHLNKYLRELEPTKRSN